MSDKDILEIGDFKKAVKETAEGEKYPAVGIRKNFTMQSVEEVKMEGTDDRVLRFVISSASVDRDDDTLSVDGWDVSNYLKNPVVLFGHDGRSPPVAKANNVFFENDLFKSDAQFMPKDMYEFSDMLYKMYLGGYMRATSVGFNPTEWTWSEARDYGIDFKKQELLEYSLVPVPANPDAIMEARKSGIETTPLVAWAEEVLDTKKYKGLYVPKSVIEKMHKDADGKSKVTIWLSNDEIIEVDTGSEETKDNDMKNKAGDDEIVADDKTKATDDETTQAGKTKTEETEEEVSNASEKDAETEKDGLTADALEALTADLTKGMPDDVVEKLSKHIMDMFETNEKGVLVLKESPDKDTINDDNEGGSDTEKDFIDDMISALGTDEIEDKTKSDEIDNTDILKGLDISAEDLAEAISSAVKSEVATLTGKLD